MDRFERLLNSIGIYRTPSDSIKTLSKTQAFQRAHVPARRLIVVCSSNRIDLIDFLLGRCPSVMNLIKLQSLLIFKLILNFEERSLREAAR